MNHQDLFDKVADHLLTQGARSINLIDVSGDMGCAYRGEDGLKCAIGALIPDEFYSRHIEGKGVGSFAVKEVLLRCGVGTDRSTLDLLKALQDMHDKEDPFCWRKSLIYLADSFNLDPSRAKERKATDKI